ncbi:hypothetical protein DPMN_132070 [Dreissena polymorpha]|uniref:Uncharacterized protein n=1 Tax=Dreissena polymorpha TaxID=45954 RepID=A0A9D4FSM3_DREPO|nr:hypothetical protein DPMN_132070 [Dreissena polymorpha]
MYRLYESLVVSILLSGCETLTLHADTERRVQALELDMSRKTAPHLQHGAQDQRVRPEQDCNT